MFLFFFSILHKFLHSYSLMACSQFDAHTEVINLFFFSTEMQWFAVALFTPHSAQKYAGKDCSPFLTAVSDFSIGSITVAKYFDSYHFDQTVIIGAILRDAVVF